MIDPGLKERTVLITGANHGIGAATALRFAAQGAKVFVTFFRENARFSQAELTEAQSRQVGGDLLYEAMRQQSGDLIATRIRDAGGRCAVWEADLSEPAEIPALFDKCEDELGPVDILVNNHTRSVHETFDPALAENDRVPLVTSAEIDRHFIVNARACALLMAEYVKHYRARRGQGGRIINISTDAAHAHVGNVNYAASKHAIESYSRSAAAEL